MNDIAKMRKEFEEKIRLAELENKYNEKLDKYGMSVHIFSEHADEGRYLASVRKNEGSWAELNEEDVQSVLENLPMTDKIRVSAGHGKYEMLSYQMETERTPQRPRTLLKIRYIHNELELWIDLPINENNPDLMQYFQTTQRELDNQTIGLYYGSVSPRRKSSLQMLPFLTWNCGRVVRFQGGIHRQVAEGIVTCVASTILCNSYAQENEK